MTIESDAAYIEDVEIFEMPLKHSNTSTRPRYFQNSTSRLLIHTHGRHLVSRQRYSPVA